MFSTDGLNDVIAVACGVGILQYMMETSLAKMGLCPYINGLSSLCIPKDADLHLIDVVQYKM